MVMPVYYPIRGGDFKLGVKSPAVGGHTFPCSIDIPAIGIAERDSIAEALSKIYFNGGAVRFQGTWNATTNTPTLVSGVGVPGHYYIVSVAGNTDLDGITDWKPGDWAVFNGTVWGKVDNTESVVSVFNRQGAVVKEAGDYDHADLAAIGASDHHIRYADSEAVTAMGAKADANPLNHDRYLDAEAVAAMGVKAPSNPLNHDQPIFGRWPQDAESLGLSTHTGDLLYSQKLRLTTPAVPVGRYRVGVSFEWAFSSGSRKIKLRLEQDDTTTLAEIIRSPNVANDFAVFAAFAYVDLTAATHFFDIDYGNNDLAIDTASIRRARLEFWRQS